MFDAEGDQVKFTDAVYQAKVNPSGHQGLIFVYISYILI